MPASSVGRTSRVTLLVLAMVAPAGLRAQAVPETRATPSGRPLGLALSVAGGFASDAPLGVSRQVAGHGLVALGYAARRSPVEARADVLWVSNGGLAEAVSVNASGVLPVARVGVAGAAVRPYVLAGAGVHDFGGGRPRAVSAHAGVGLRAERPRYAAFGEWRRHAAYGRSFLSLGASWRR